MKQRGHLFEARRAEFGRARGLRSSFKYKGEKWRPEGTCLTLRSMLMMVECYSQRRYDR